MEWNLLTVAIGLFVIGAVFGLIVLTAILTNKPTPKPMVFIHGGLVATALVLVFISFFTGARGVLLGTSLVLFVLAALGGFTLFFIDMQKKIIPKWLAIIHPLAAASALVLLIVNVLMPPSA